MKKLNATLALVLLLIVAPILSLAQVVVNPGGGGSATSSGSTISGCTSSILYADASSLLKCDPAAVVNGSVSTAGRSMLTIRDTISGSSATSNFLNITGTVPASLSAETSGVLISMAGVVQSQPQNTLRVFATGSGPNGGFPSYAVYADNQQTGAFTVGVKGLASGAAVLNNAGVVGIATAGGTGRIGGYFSLVAEDPPATTAALAISNGSVAANIFEARDNGTALFTIQDGGDIILGSGPKWLFSTSGSNNDMQLGTGFLDFGSAYNVVDVRLSRDAAATLQLGADVNGAAVNQTLKAHDGITGTDIKGASLTLSPGLGTGAAVSNPLTLNRVVTKATGTTAQTYSPAVVVCPTKILSNTSATAQTIATITTTSTTGGSVTMDYTTVANNGTLQDTDSGMVKVSWNNNAGTVAAAMTAVVMQSDSDASGTLATTPTATVATNVVSIKFTPTWVTIVPTTVTGWATFTLHTSGDTVACQ